MTDQELSNYYNEERLFWVADSSEKNEEIFTCKQDALEYLQATDMGDDPRLRICIVRHAYQEDDGGWNYDDCDNTFETVKEIAL